MITAAVFSITGLGVLNLALLVNIDTSTAARTIEYKIDAESAVNIALWRVNNGEDSLGTYSEGNVNSFFDSTELSLTVSVINAGDTSGFKVFIERDHHFNHVMSTSSVLQAFMKAVSSTFIFFLDLNARIPFHAIMAPLSPESSLGYILPSISGI